MLLRKIGLTCTNDRSERGQVTFVNSFIFELNDHNFGTFDDFGVKNDQNIRENMVEKRAKKFGHG